MLCSANKMWTRQRERERQRGERGWAVPRSEGVPSWERFAPSHQTSAIPPSRRTEEEPPSCFALCGLTDNSALQLRKWFCCCRWLPFTRWASLAEHPPPLTVSVSPQCAHLSAPLLCGRTAGGAPESGAAPTGGVLRAPRSWAFLLLQKQRRDYCAAPLCWCRLSSLHFLLSST